MTPIPAFLSVVLVVRNQSGLIERLLREATDAISPHVSDYELIVVDNASEDATVSLLGGLTAEEGLPNLQVYALTKEVDPDTACWVGLENALGDFIAVADPLTDDIALIPTMVRRAAEGADVVFAVNQAAPRRSVAYRVCYALFNSLYKRFGGLDLARDAPQFRVLSKRVVTFILQHPHPARAYRYLPATAGFARAKLEYSTVPRGTPARPIWDSVDRGMRMLVSTTRVPMRLVTALSLFGAVSNLVYSLYVIAVALLKSDVAPGWVTLSLQQSGMFLLISLVLLVLGEYILQMASHSNEGPPYHVAQEFTSARLTRRERLNVQEPPATPARADSIANSAS